MPIETNAAVVDSVGAPFSFTTLLLDDPRPDEVRVAIEAVGLCHTDLGVQQGHLRTRFPAVLGHEGAGVVDAIGSAVTGLAVGDRVVLSFSSCGSCPACLLGRRAYCRRTPQMNLAGTRPDGSATLHTLDGAPVNGRFFGQSSFAQHTVVRAADVVRVPDELLEHSPVHLVAPLGCGVQTGVGTVLTSLNVPAGASILVTGAGAVGLSAVMGAVVAGASTIIAVDVVEERLATARRLGATHTLDPRDGPISRKVRAITGGGVDHAVDTTGNPDVIAALFSSTVFGGSLALVGVPRPGTTLDLGLISASGKSVVGAIEGDAVPQEFIPRLLRMHADGRLPLGVIVQRYSFTELEQAVDDTLAGRVVKAVLLMP